MTGALTDWSGAMALPTTLARLPTPSLLVDIKRLDANIAEMAQRMMRANVKLRPHVKTSKCWEVVRRQLAAGAIGFTCSTPAEVMWLQQRGVGNLMWAHAPVGPRKVDFAVAAALRGGFTVSIDSVAIAKPLSEEATAAKLRIPAVLEINTGHARSGVEPEEALTVAREIDLLPGIGIKGVLTHEGHVARHLGDPEAMHAEGRRAGELLVSVASQLQTAGLPMEIVSVGSTPGSASAPFVPGVTEARPGTYVYYDVAQTSLGSAAREQCAASVLTRVVSVQRRGRAVIDAGVKAMSSDGAATGRFGTPCHLDWRPVQGVEFAEGNEEHGFLVGPGADELVVGDLLRLIPNHACGTTNMFSGLFAVDGTTALEHWPIAARY